MEAIERSQLIKIKDNEQRKALNSWAAKGFKGSIIAGTGFGKSRCGVLGAGYVLRKKGKESKGIVLTPTTQLRSQFAEEFAKWGYEDVEDKLEHVCYQSAYKMSGNHYDVVICDEIHLGLSKEYRKFFENNTFDALLCLTATPPEEEEYNEYLSKLAPVVYYLSMESCVNLGLISPYDIFCVPVSLTSEEKKEYKKINNSFVYWKMQLGFDAFSEAKRILGDKSASGSEKQAAARFYASIRARKKIVDFASNKIALMNSIVKSNLPDKMLVFGGANEFTDTLSESLGDLSVSYHSGMSKKKRDSNLKSFKEGDTKVLCSTKALNQGLDVPDARVGIVCGLTSKSLPMIQRIGRLVRFQKGKRGKIYILYVKDSQEEKWLKSSLKGLSNIQWM